LSDGKDIIINEPLFGQIIECSPETITLEPSYKSLKCTLTNEQINTIFNLIKKEYNHKQISDKFQNDYNPTTIITELYEQLRVIEKNKNKYVITLATENYSNNLNLLLTSLQHTNPNKLVIVYYIGWRDSLVEQFKKVYDKYSFEEIILENYNKGDIIKLKVKLQHECYFKYKLQFIWIDADSIVLNSLDPLFEKIGMYNLIVYHRPNEENHMKFAVAVIGFGMSKKEQNINETFINLYNEKCKTTLGLEDWFYDQTSIYEAYEELKDKIKLYALSENEHSINDTLDTIVYSRRNVNKKNLKDILIEKKIKINNINFDEIELKYA